MKIFLPLMMVLVFLFNGMVLAKKKSSDEMDSSGKTSKHHSRKKGSKGSKGSNSKSGAEFKVESEVNHANMTIDFKEKDKGKKKGKSKKKKVEDPSYIPLEDPK